MYKRNILRSSIIRLYEQYAMYSAKGSSAPYDGEKQTKERNHFGGASCCAPTEQTLHSDSHGLQISGNWNQHWFTELRGDRSGRLSGTGTYTVSRNMDRTLRAAMEYLQIAAKRLQR
ncbi:hypothetical protein P5V15_001239 [Pogonomyrmex californicus]